MQTPHDCEVPFPASSRPRQVACVQMPASQGCPTSETGHAIGSQKPHAYCVTPPSSTFESLQVDATQTPTH